MGTKGLILNFKGMVERADTVEESDANENATCYHEELKSNRSVLSVEVQLDLPAQSFTNGQKFDWSEGKIGILQESLMIYQRGQSFE